MTLHERPRSQKGISTFDVAAMTDSFDLWGASLCWADEAMVQDSVGLGIFCWFCLTFCMMLLFRFGGLCQMFFFFIQKYVGYFGLISHFLGFNPQFS